MAGSSNQFVYAMQATLITVATGSTATPVTPPAHCLGHILKYSSGGSLAIVGALGLGATTGYLLGTTEQLATSGPAQFFLNASGATAIVQVIWQLSAGISQLP